MRPSELLEQHRDAIRAIVLSHHARNARVFGSAARNEDGAESDLDLLIDPTEETTFFDIGAIRAELRSLLGIDVDVLTPDALPPSFRSHVIKEALPV